MISEATPYVITIWDLLLSMISWFVIGWCCKGLFGYNEIRKKLKEVEALLNICQKYKNEEENK